MSWYWYGGGRPRPPLEQLARIKGAMWTARAPLPYGPRPYQPSNCICMDYFECYAPPDRDLAIAAYGPQSERRYRHAPLGPIVDPGYHGQLPATDWRSNFGVYLSAAEQLEDAGIEPIHFLRPDRGVSGLEWTVADLDRELTPLFMSTRAQDAMRVVVIGWEPGPRYFYDNAWWVQMAEWQARVFPHALRLIHMVADCDAPVGGDDDRRGISNGQGWQNVAPFLHGWLVQNGGYVFGASQYPSVYFMNEFAKQWRTDSTSSLTMRFRMGGPSGDWPTWSAWGQEKGLLPYAGEYAAFGDYNWDWPEDIAQSIGDAAMATGGCPGYLDGGTVEP